MRNTELFDKYLNEGLNADEKLAFESRLNADELFAAAFNEHKTLINALNEHEKSQQFKAKLKQIHHNEFGKDAKVISINKEETFSKRYGRVVMVAASTALIAVLSTVAILGTGGYLLKKQSNQITELGLKLKASNEAIVEGISRGSQKTVYAPANMEGSAFALNNKGYIITSFHIINSADSVFVENGVMQRTLAKVVITDPKLDLAILKIDNIDLIKNWQVPFSFAARGTDVGEKVFTLGYPRKDMVYGEGSLSSLSGYNNDTSMYQISIPVNPGNSGSPLLDENGNVIGVIRGKITSAEATGFAVKSAEIIKSLQTLSSDSIQPSKMAKRPVLKGLKRTEQIKRINPYVFNILVYKKD